ncbi:Predicted amidohydrolase [Flavobacterium aquidurense]|uniref:Nitrilase family protein n=1 Tax=Flavobacterium frigidimaris TaxID=262320 RepID=A0ABX4BWM6_FLAFR|nr:nitrilase family protein [Flavobacterium frigidimaris]OXA82566.1 nitrilase family protein [Flavobacterium frigidimaris]SDZ46773.1 Predicted amidohydrolase [Flavobacterium aquidurense]
MIVTLIQSDLYWEDPSENRKKFESKINQIDSEVNLIVLPEMFSTGFTMNASEVAETMQGETVLWMQRVAKQRKCAITGSLIIAENNQFYNRMLFVFPSGEIQYYDKRHLFSLAGEDRTYTGGKEKVIVDYLGWKICLQICYDLRFPVFVRNVENYDLILYVANWPKVRTNAWDILLKARAVENLSYVIGVNRIGLDTHNYEHIGHSQVVDYLGDYILEPEETEGVFRVELDKIKMLETRKKLDFLSDKDSFEINI